MSLSARARLHFFFLLAGAALICFADRPAFGELSPAAIKHWTADNGNGTYSNPLFYEEFEDPDVIRVDKDYYLAGTTMHMNPALQIMHSRDLVNWELVGYCMERLDLGPAFRLEGGNVYGKGIWAPCIRYHEGVFYIFSNVNGVGLQVFRSKTIDAPWKRNQLPGRHDLSVLFDDDLAKIFIIHGNKAPYPIEQLAPDLNSFVIDAPKRSLPEKMGEGHHLYKINGKYVDVSAIPGGAVDQMVAVADSIDGPWKVTRMVQGESLGVTQAAPERAGPNDRGLWIHQGGMCDTPSGEWWSVIMSDHGSAGRMVNLVPITWDGGFPLIGLPGNLRKAPNTWLKPNTGDAEDPKPAFNHDDNFDSGKLNPLWQWNHVPDDAKWSLTERPGVLRLHSLMASSFWSARNSLCQRPPGPESVMTVELDCSGLKVGDNAGLALLSTPYAGIGMVRSSEGTRLQFFSGTADVRRGGATAPTNANTMIRGPENPPSHVWLRVACNFDLDEAIFSWSADGEQFTPFGNPFVMTFQLTTFQGVRPALFNFNTSSETGGLGQVGRPSDAGSPPGEPWKGQKARGMAELTNAIQKFFLENTRLGIPVIFHEECLHGHAARDATSFPQPIGLGATFNPVLVEQLFTMTAYEARVRGTHQALTPVVDVARDPRWGFELPEPDCYISARNAAAPSRPAKGDSNGDQTTLNLP